MLGQAPAGEQLRGLTAAILRLGSGDVPGLRRAVGAAFGLDEPALARRPGRPRRRRRPGCWSASPGPAASAGDLIDRLEEAQMALLRALDGANWREAAVPDICAEVLGTADPGLERALRFAAARGRCPAWPAPARRSAPCSPRLGGRFVPAGPSGSPTRGRVDVLPTGRNFYAIDPRSLPSELAWDVGRRLADALLARHLAEEGAYPRDGGPGGLGHLGHPHRRRRRRRDPGPARRAARPGAPSRGGSPAWR